MKDIIAALIMLGALVGVWYWIANKFQQKGTGAITRHFAGFVCGIGALFVAGIVVAAMGLLDSESNATKPQAADTEHSSSESSAASAPAEIDASDAENMAAQSSSEDLPASEAVENVEPENKPNASGNSVADRRDEIQAGSDIGVDVETFITRFNESMASLELPYRAKGNIPEMAENHVQRSFDEAFNDHLALMVTAKPRTDDIRDLMFIGTGDGTAKSGANVLMVAAATFSATQESWPVGDVIEMLADMTEKYHQQGTKVTRTLNGLEYSYNQSDLLGNMFSVSLSE
ncbi:hypothetical protein SAMN05421509_10744 [Chromohalobacter canadensis]|uniref:Uncharacterized protein n=1 Tax=Chromohalobacter canadensis TaxID=141389 RepID=A0A285VQY1_9GAMM|nr:lipase chaperone [Chromohalobacter canadensis]SOC56445.1 hypothetical protein SAMN05421509_10744 [Chromohalobacter canadensis]